MLNEIRIFIANILNIVIIDNPYVFLDLWSFVHLFAGIGIMYLLLKRRIPIPFLFLFVFVVVFEIIEYAFYTHLFTQLFIPEMTLNVIWDIIIGMLGGTITYFSFKNKTFKN